MIDWEIRKFLKLVLTVQIVVYAVVAIDVPVARQVIGFIYLTFIPGLILLRVFRIHGRNMTETTLFSVSLSITFLMLCGVLINELYYAAGISKPLSPQFVLPTFVSCTLGLSVLAYVIDRGFSTCVEKGASFPKSSFLLVCLPFLSILGATLLNNSGNNSVSLLSVTIISGLVILGTAYEKVIQPSYSLVLLAAALALLFLLSFTSRYIIGYDIHLEYNVFKLTEAGFHWSIVAPSSSLAHSTYYGMLSITILPTIFSSILNMDGTWIFKIVYPLIFSLTTLGLYQIYRKQFGDRTAFLSTFLFMSFNTFLDQMLGLGRQMIAELFFIVIMLVLLDTRMKGLERVMLYVFLSAALVVSHYSVSYLFMFFILSAFLLLPLLRNVDAEQHRARALPMYFILIFFVIALSWYTFTSTSAPLTNAAGVGKHILSSAFELFNPETRSSDVMRALGVGPSVSTLHEIGRTMFQLVQVLIIIGFINVTFTRKRTKVNPTYYLMAFASMVILGMCIVLPFFSSSLNTSRFYHITLIFLAPFFIIGCDSFFGWIPRIRHFRLSIISIMLILFFLFQSGFIYEVTCDVPYWGALSKHRIDPLNNFARWEEYTHEQEFFSAQWLSQRMANTTKIYADRLSNNHVLTSYGMLLPEYQANWGCLLSNDSKGIENDACIYLGYLNIVYVLAEGPESENLWHITEISPLLDKCNTLYSNGASSILRSAG